jgi:hypothetical protein
LRHGPLGAVWRPNADSIARIQPERKQAGRKEINVLFELRVTPPNLLPGDDECIALGKSARGLVERATDGFVFQRHRTGAFDEA